MGTTGLHHLLVSSAALASRYMSVSNIKAKYLLDIVATIIGRERRMNAEGVLEFAPPKIMLKSEAKWAEHTILADIELEGHHVYNNILRALTSLDYMQQACAAKRLDGQPFSAAGLKRLNEIRMEVLMQASLGKPLCTAGERA